LLAGNGLNHHLSDILVNDLNSGQTLILIEFDEIFLKTKNQLNLEFSVDLWVNALFWQ
jgi:hypothetical protein